MEEKLSKSVKPDNFLLWAVLSTVLCCLPFGIVAIVYANKVDQLWYAGKYNEAEEALKKAKIWTFVTVGVGVVSTILSFLVMFIFGIFFS
ncbi:MAG: CD225/dispanin family protein [Prevotellaceae bacterium]|nr:CD225/dispanin family protein [Prevotellaceae bacterium]